MTAFRHRFIGAIVEIHRLIDEGRIGPLVFLQNVFCSNSFNMKDRWFSKRAVSGGGCLMDTTIHSVDLFRYLVGEITEQHAVMNKTIHGADVEAAGILVVKADNGAIGSLASAWVAGTDVAYISIMGQKGQILYDYTEPGTVKVKQSNEAEWQTITAPVTNGISEEIGHLLAAIRGECDLSCTAHDGFRAVEVVCSVY